MPKTHKSATPTISYGGKKLMFVCDTEDVEFVTEIKDADIGTFYDDRITLSATYEISVYATKAGYENSDKATATLVWANATFTDTTPEPTAISPAAEMAPVPVLIQSNSGIVTVQGAADCTPDLHHSRHTGRLCRQSEWSCRNQHQPHLWLHRHHQDWHPELQGRD